MALVPNPKIVFCRYAEVAIENGRVDPPERFGRGPVNGGFRNHYVGDSLEDF